MSRAEEMQLLRDSFAHVMEDGYEPVGYGTEEALIALNWMGIRWESTAKIEELRSFFEATIACAMFSPESNGIHGYEMSEDVGWWSLEEASRRGPDGIEFGRNIFVRSPATSKLFGFASFGWVQCYVECSGTDFWVVSNLPMEDPLPTLLDYCISALRVPSEEWRNDPNRCGGALFQMAYGWDDPEHNYRFDGHYLRQVLMNPGLESSNLYRSNLQRDPDLDEYAAWLAEKRAFARQWLEQTRYPPKWFPGVEPHLP